MKDRKSKYKVDYPLIMTILIICAIGLTMVYSTTLSLSPEKRIPAFRTQVIATVAGIAAMIVLMFLDYKVFGKLYIVIYAVSITLLLLTLVMGINTNGAKSWLRIGGKVFQPSEFVKVGLIISFAKIIENNCQKINEPFTLLKVLIIAFVPVVLVLMQPDFGTAIVFIFFIFIMLYTAGISLKYIFYAIGIGILSIPLLWFKLDSYQKNRIYNFIDPSRDTVNTGRQMMQGRIAIGSGELFGRGLFKGPQNMYNYVSEKHTDYIFSILVEELGFVGGTVLIFLYYIMFMRMINISKNSSNIFGRTMVAGFTGMFLFHIFQNIGMTVGVVPVTGIPLPFLSYAGTFQLANLISIGLVLSVKYHYKKSRFDNDEFDILLQNDDK